MQVNLHAIGKSTFAANIHQVPGNVPVISIRVGDAEVSIFLHDDNAEKALASLEHAIRVFQMESEPETAINGVDDSVRLDG